MKTPRVINHGTQEESYHCRECKSSGFANTATALVKAKHHSTQTGHTVDVYKETWQEVTYYKNGKREFEG